GTLLKAGPGRRNRGRYGCASRASTPSVPILGRPPGHPSARHRPCPPRGTAPGPHWPVPVRGSTVGGPGLASAVIRHPPSDSCPAAPAAEGFIMASSNEYTVPGLSLTKGRGVADELQHRLHALNDLHLSLKHAHWNVTGPNFIAVHEML